MSLYSWGNRGKTLTMFSRMVEGEKMVHKREADSSSTKGEHRLQQLVSETLNHARETQWELMPKRFSFRWGSNPMEQLLSESLHAKKA